MTELKKRKEANTQLIQGILALFQQVIEKGEKQTIDNKKNENNRFGLISIYRTVYLQMAEYTFFSNTLKIFYK